MFNIFKSRNKKEEPLVEVTKKKKPLTGGPLVVTLKRMVSLRDNEILSLKKELELTKKKVIELSSLNQEKQIENTYYREQVSLKDQEIDSLKNG